MFYCTAYGLTISSALALPDLAAIAPTPNADVEVRLGAVEPPPGHDSATARAFHATPDECWLYWQRAGLVAVRAGREIVVDPAPNIETRLLSLAVSGPALGVLLHQRGTLALHASAVAIDGAAVAFMGESGEGKSTTAAAFHASGHTLVCDDIVALGESADGALVFPALPRIKLYPHAAAALSYDLDQMQVFDSADVRRSYRLRSQFVQQPLPLRHLFVLADGPECRIEPLAPRAAFLQLLRHSYALRFIGSSGNNGQHFRQCEQLIRDEQVLRLERPRALERLPEVVQLVAAQLAGEVVA